MKKSLILITLILSLSLIVVADELEINELANKITENCLTDESRYQSIFKWVAENISYDITFESLKNGGTEPDSVLKYRKSVCSGYANLYKALCEKAGLDCEIIHGMAKGIGYQPGDSFETNHDWNAIYYNKKWHLIDVTWASGYVMNGEFCKTYQDFYWDTDPDKLIFTHFPEDKEWQLLENPKDVDWFLSKIGMHPIFWKLNVNPEYDNNEIHALLEYEDNTFTKLMDKTYEYVLTSDCYIMAKIYDFSGKIIHDCNVKKNGNKSTILFPPLGEEDFIMRIFGSKSKYGDYELLYEFKLIFQIEFE